MENRSNKKQEESVEQYKKFISNTVKGKYTVENFKMSETIIPRDEYIDHETINMLNDVPDNMWLYGISN